MITTKPWVLITGANGGIGEALVDAFLRSDYEVIRTDIIDIGLDIHGSSFIACDLEEFVNYEEYADNFCSEVNRLTKGNGLSALVNNAATQILGNCHQITREKWKKSFDVNVSAPFFLIQNFINSLSSNQGAIVNISSVHASLTKKEFLTYATTKASLSALTRNLAVNLLDKVRINAIEPAAVSTKMLQESFKNNQAVLKKLESFHPLQRIATPQEIAEIAVFLCSDKASFIHGECIKATGGIHGCLHDPI